MAVLPSASYSLTVRLQITNRPGMLGRVASAIGAAGGDIGAVDLVESGRDRILRDLTVNARDSEHGQEVVNRLRRVPGVKVINVSDRTFLLHLGGKIEIKNKVPVKTRDDLSMAYTPGVARVCMAIHEDPAKAFNLTIKANTVAIVTDGTAVLGLGNIGPDAAMPVMEGKALLFKEFGGVDAFPLCLSTQDVDEIVRIVQAVAPTFGGINLEDIASPRCFEIEERLKATLDIPVFHDDQHGTAVVVLAALLNALKITGKRIEDLDVLIVGLGAAGIAVAKILLAAGVDHIVGCDSKGALSTDRPDYQDGSMPALKRWFAETTHKERRSGAPADVIEGADLFIGLSGAKVMPAEALDRMAADAMVFAMANPTPEVAPEDAERYARIIA